DDLIIDNSTSKLFSTIGTWTSTSGGYKNTYQKADAANGDTAYYKVRILRSGQYLLYGYWGGDSASNSGNVIVDASSLYNANETDTINQKLHLNNWNYISKFNFISGDTVTIKLYGTGGGSLIADAFRLKRGNLFEVVDSAMSDSETVLLKFSNALINPVSEITKVTSSLSNTNLNFLVNTVDNTVLRVSIPSVSKGTSFKLNITGLVDVLFDTLNVSVNIIYNPDSTVFILDDQSQSSFWKLTGTWSTDTSYSASGGVFYKTKQTSSYSRVEWGPQKIYLDGYYDVYVNIPKTSLPLTDNSLYIIKDHFATDSIYISQAANAGSVIKLGSFPFRSNEQFAVLLTSVTGADTGKYLTADEITVRRVVEITDVAGDNVTKPEKFVIYQNYPNPFNPSTNIDFYLPSKAKVYIEIYNILGEKVRELLDGKEFNQGDNKIRFDGTNLSSGIYFAVIRIKGQNYSGQKALKMVLLK
ncbi:MAG: T9SS type A sorting domain-containing protein, partial [Ignavibacteriaceae bacterium]|nr:T9SS type A sorting domain-containing protein [Ignavibacteriaceae bacterium]